MTAPLYQRNVNNVSDQEVRDHRLEGKTEQKVAQDILIYKGLCITRTTMAGVACACSRFRYSDLAHIVVISKHQVYYAHGPQTHQAMICIG